MGDVLSEIKQSLGVDPSVQEYDVDIVMHINSVYTVLNQICNAPLTVITNETNWSDLIANVPEAIFVKSYLYVSVKILFDQPQLSFLLKALQDQKAEYEWRLRELEGLFI